MTLAQYDIRCHVWLYPFLCLQITRPDISSHVTWAVSQVTVNGQFTFLDGVLSITNKRSSNVEALGERRPPWPRQIITPIFPNVIMLSLGGERLPALPLTHHWDHYLHHDLGMLPLLWCFFAHLLILEYSDNHQNLISPSLYYPGPLHKISSQSVHNFLSNVVHRQTDKPTLPKNISSFAKEVINILLFLFLFISIHVHTRVCMRACYQNVCIRMCLCVCNK